MLNAKTMLVRPHFVFAALLFAMAVAPLRAHASYTVFVDFGGTIPMTSTQKGFEKTGKCLSFSLAAEMPVEVVGQQAAGHANVTPVTLSRLLDAASPKIWQRLLTGGLIPTVKVILANDVGQRIAEWELTDVLISSYSVSGSGGGDEAPYETFSLTYAKIKYTVNTIDKAGKVSGSTTFGWDLVENVKL